MHIIYGLALMAIGTVLVGKANWLLNNFGSIPFFDRYFGTEGGSRFGYKLIGILVIFFGILILTGLVKPFLLWMFSPLLKHNVVPQDF